MKILGVTMAFNEADCIGNALDFLTRMCDHVVAFDHGSTDGTEDIIKIKTWRHPVRYVRVGRKGTDLGALFARIARFVRSKEEFDWVVWIAADEVLSIPDGTRQATREDLVKEADRGIVVIRPRVREFWITDVDGESPNCIDRMRHYRFFDAIGPITPRAWLQSMTGQMPYGLHRRDDQWGVPKSKISAGSWLIDHYPIRTVQQGRRKIMKERRPRAKYNPFLKAGCKNLVVNSSKLTCRDQEVKCPV